MLRHDLHPHIDGVFGIGQVNAAPDRLASGPYGKVVPAIDRQD